MAGLPTGAALPVMVSTSMSWEVARYSKSSSSCGDLSMSSCVTTPRPPPRLSCTFGPLGTTGSGGSGPRFALMAWTRSVLLSASHCTVPPPGAPPRPAAACPNTSLTLTPSMRWVLPVAASPTQISIPFSVELVKTKCLPSGLQRAVLILGLGGRATLISAPSGILRRVRELLKVALCRPLVSGLMRMPARRRIGMASSAIGG